MSSTSDIKQESVNSRSLDIREAIKNTALKMGPEISKEEKKEHAKLLVKIFEKGMSPKEAMQVSDEDAGLIYSFAYSLFNAGKYKEACELFKVLFTLDPQESGSATALAVCYHKMKDYETAIIFYLIQAKTDPFDPVPLFYCYDCFMNMNDLDGAYLSLLETIKTAHITPGYHEIEQKAKALLEGFDQAKLSAVTKAIAAGMDR